MGHPADQSWVVRRCLDGLDAPDSWKIKEGRRGRALQRLGLLVGLGLLTAGCGFPVGTLSPIHATLAVSKPARVPASAPVRITFDRPVDPLSAQVMLRPDVPSSIVWSPRALQITPDRMWEPGTTYTVTVAHLRDQTRSFGLDGWRARFTAQPRLGVGFVTARAAAASPGLPFTGGSDLSPSTVITVRFGAAMQPSSVTLTLNGRPADAAAAHWDPTATEVSIEADRLALGQPYTLAVTAGRSVTGDELTDPGQVAFRVLPVEPSNGSSRIGAGFQTVVPLQVVIENSGPARPQSGLQQADIVYEYISEYSITRMTAMYFNNPPAVMGPVRSCRLINPPLNFAFHAFTMCSGASVGTLHFMFDLNVPAAINDFDRHGYFYRVGFKAAPHNLYTSGGRAPNASRRARMQPTPPYLIDPPHPDNGLGQPAGAPSVPLHAVSYRYDAGSQQYYRYDHGAPFVEALTGSQLHVKNVILIHTPYKVMSFVEDENGGARSVRYFVYNQDESGPAQIYSDGKLINATWHMGWSSPMYFTDQDGKFIELNTGLTWIHVLGNGQTG